MGLPIEDIDLALIHSDLGHLEEHPSTARPILLWELMMARRRERYTLIPAWNDIANKGCFNTPAVN